MTTPTAASHPALTPREAQVLAHLAHGDTNHTIARRLHLSPHTVDTYLRRLRLKTGTTNRTQLAVLAHQLGYTTTPP
ncbi:helix-turn-helix transcriptional regulator [Kitasatospora sp. NPDC096077]|uniref:response regulator transcription factor n=1 Tax=Kitasatospora sp. NPDC096077 TaxID=3155544 RepID=UPI003332E43D